MSWDHEAEEEFPPPEEDFATAQRLFAQGELSHAALHIGRALGGEPNQIEWLSLLDHIITQAGDDPLRLAPLETHGVTPYTIVAVRAYIFERIGQVSEAVDWLLQVMCVHPELPYAQWLLNWQHHPNFAAGISPNRLAQAAFALTRNLPELATEPLQRMETLLAMAVAVYPQKGSLWWAYSIVVRKLDRLEEALALAQHGYELAPGYETAVALSSAHRYLNNIDKAIEQAIVSLEYDPHDIAIRNDIADMYSDQGHLREAADWYQQVLDIQPEEDWALPSYYYAMYMLQPDMGWLEKLYDYYGTHMMNRRALVLLMNTRQAWTPDSGQ